MKIRLGRGRRPRSIGEKRFGWDMVVKEKLINMELRNSGKQTRTENHAER
jgi:hypothetical protein